MIGITIETHTRKAIANELAACGSAGLPPRPRDLSSVAVVPDEVTPLLVNVPGLTGGESAIWVAARLGGGCRVAAHDVRRRLGLAAHIL